MRAHALIAVILFFAPIACASDGATVRYGNGPSMEEAWRQPYNGPKARLAVVKVVDKTATGSSDIGDGLADMLTTALFHTNRYVMLDRTDLADVMTEQDLASAGRANVNTGAPIGELEGAELLVFGA
ncbi:MAG: hypothetical protein HQK87_11545, partial [Nitrospinae bacterium]|nr:hypothetical protein [Nitrospinota bacterium]